MTGAADIDTVSGIRRLYQRGDDTVVPRDLYAIFAPLAQPAAVNVAPDFSTIH